MSVKLIRGTDAREEAVKDRAERHVERGAHTGAGGAFQVCGGEVRRCVAW